MKCGAAECSNQSSMTQVLLSASNKLAQHVCRQYLLSKTGCYVTADGPLFQQLQDQLTTAMQKHVEIYRIAVLAATAATPWLWLQVMLVMLHASHQH
jgi:hypothetical protein